MLYSIIIPHRNSVDLLPKLFSSIPVRSDIEILVIDNSPEPVTKEDIGLSRTYELLYSDPARGAGGARNTGLDAACGKWVIFADADDFFSGEAFQAFDRYADSDNDVVFFCATGVDALTGGITERGDYVSEFVRHYLADRTSEKELRSSYCVPWGKMVRRSLLEKHQIRFDECVAANDIVCSLKIGIFAERIDACDTVVYCVSTVANSLTRRSDFSVMQSRFLANLRFNRLARKHGMGEYQHSIMYLFIRTVKTGGFRVFFPMVWELLRSGQNPFVGCSNWANTMRKQKTKE